MNETYPERTAPAGDRAGETASICPGDHEAVLAAGKALRIGPDVIRELLKTRNATLRAQMHALTAGTRNANRLFPYTPRDIL